MDVDIRDLPFPIFITDVSALPGYRIALEFMDGKRGVFDMGKYLDWNAFRPLRDPAVFDAVQVVDGVPTWPGEIDIAPERLWTDCVPLEGA